MFPTLVGTYRGAPGQLLAALLLHLAGTGLLGRV